METSLYFELSFHRFDSRFCDSQTWCGVTPADDWLTIFKIDALIYNKKYFAIWKYFFRRQNILYFLSIKNEIAKLRMDQAVFFLLYSLSSKKIESVEESDK